MSKNSYTNQVIAVMAIVTLINVTVLVIVLDRGYIIIIHRASSNTPSNIDFNTRLAIDVATTK